jgi:L-Lysine epsilon oxidase N-terminal
LDKAVYLGELQTDKDGRLIVLGGKGTSAKTDEGKPITNYANNDFWHDDVSDGPISAIVYLDDRQIPVKGAAWVIVAPPKFAPHLINLVTLYDGLKETCGIAPPDKVSFTQDIYPIFDRATKHQWVNPMGVRGHGPGKDKSISRRTRRIKSLDRKPQRRASAYCRSR